MLRHIVHFGDQQIFPGATNYVCLLFLAKAGAKAGCAFVRADNLTQWLRTLKGAEGTIPASDIKEVEWNFAVGRGADIFERLKTMPVKLGTVADIFVGLQTSADKIFVLESKGAAKGEHTTVYDRQGTEFELETGILKHFLLDVSLRPYGQPESGHCVIFPYELTNSSASLIPQRTMASEFPRTWAYLRKHADALKARDRGKWNHEQWYAFGRSQSLALMDAPKLVVQVLDRSPRFSFDSCSLYFTCGGNGPYYGVRWLAPEAPSSLHFLQALMNSPVTAFFIRKTSTTFHGDYWSYGKRFIENLPVCALNLTNATERARHDAIVWLVEWLLWLHRQPKVTESTREHPRDPLIAAYFAQWVNALVYELYFPQELQSAGLRFFALTSEHALPPVTEWHEKDERLPKIRERLDKLNAAGHPLRRALDQLQTLDLVRIVEGNP